MIDWDLVLVGGLLFLGFVCGMFIQSAFEYTRLQRRGYSRIEDIPVKVNELEAGKTIKGTTNPNPKVFGEESK